MKVKDIESICFEYLTTFIIIASHNVHSYPDIIAGIYSARSEFTNVHKTVPVLYHDKLYYQTFAQTRHPRKLTMTIDVFGKFFTLDLHINTGLLSAGYTEKQIHSGREYTRSPSQRDHVKDDCYYHGMIRGLPHSYAAVSTCHGISGVLNDAVTTYHIEPSISGNLTDEHFVYRDVDHKPRNVTCGVDLEEQKKPHLITYRMKRSVIHAPASSNSSTRYIELYLVTDNRLYQRLGRDTTRIFRRCKDIVNIVSRLYKQLNIYVVLVGAEIWMSGDQISVVNEPDRTMTNFLHYRKVRINPFHRNDNAQLLTGITFSGGVVGKAVKGPICTFRHSGGVNMDNSVLVSLVATTVAHELGHNLGMHHDNDTCVCADAKCIMAVTTGGTHPTHWSSCSVKSLNEAFHHGMDYCLRNIPKTVFQGPVCGNGFTEQGEECDCGLPDVCENKCCNATTCKLQASAECATGKCCDRATCRIKAEGIECRAKQQECDLPEYCNGHNEYCPADIHKHDGTLCENGKAYCYKGSCPSRDSQCRLLWGPTGRTSYDICYQKLNTLGNGNGNCGYNLINKSYASCPSVDVMCGMLHCIHLNEKLKFWKDAFAVTLPASFIETINSRVSNRKFICRGAVLDVGLDMPDPGMVPDGAKCGHERVCIKRQCRHLSVIHDPRYTNVTKTTACMSNCSGHGVCNSRGNCHCDAGWEPPTCDRRGKGGSIDSNSANKPYEDKDLSLMIGLLVFFLAIMPLVVLLLFCAYRHRAALHVWCFKHPSIKYRFSTLLKSSQSGSPAAAKASPVVKTAKAPAQSKPVARAHSLRFGPPPEISHPVLTSSTNRDSKAYIDCGAHDPARSVAPPVTTTQTSVVLEGGATHTVPVRQNPGVYMNVPQKPPARPPPPRPRSSYEPEVSRNATTRTSSLRTPPSSSSSRVSGEVTVHNNDLRTIEDYRIEMKPRSTRSPIVAATKSPAIPSQRTADETGKTDAKSDSSVVSKPTNKTIYRGDARHDSDDKIDKSGVKKAMKPLRSQSALRSGESNKLDAELMMKFKQRGDGSGLNSANKVGDKSLAAKSDAAKSDAATTPRNLRSKDSNIARNKSSNQDSNKDAASGPLVESNKPSAAAANSRVNRSEFTPPSNAAGRPGESSVDPVRSPATRSNSAYKPQPLPKPKFNV